MFITECFLIASSSATGLIKADVSRVGVEDEDDKTSGSIGGWTDLTTVPFAFCQDL